jgi:hypothetical protein
MSKLIKVAAILAIAAATLAARQIAMQVTANGTGGAASLATRASTIAPGDMMRKAGPLPQTDVADYN